MARTYIAIDLKSFFASAECVSRGLDPLRTNLVVADKSRTEKTICLAVTPPLKAIGIPGRARLFEVIEKVREANCRRKSSAPCRTFTGASVYSDELAAHPELSIDYIVAPPRMSLYMKMSAEVYGIYLKYISPDDIHVYSIDEVFIDATEYLRLYRLSARELAMKIILDILKTTGITATAGIGENMYLCKVALDIEAKRIPPDKNGVRIAELTELLYREKLWEHRPITDFWRVGRGTAKKLEAVGIHTMGDIALCSVGEKSGYYNEDLLYKLFGVNAELLIDHAWGWESCTIADVKAYRPESSSICSGQVLQSPYTFEKARLVIREMADMLVYDLLEKRLVTNQIVLDVGYDIENLTNPEISAKYRGATVTDHYGRRIPRPSHGSANLGEYTSSTRQILACVDELFSRIANPELTVRRLNITACGIVKESEAPREMRSEQLDMFTDIDAMLKDEETKRRELERERRRQLALIEIKKRYGKNAILKGMNFKEGATARERGGQIGGHKA